MTPREALDFLRTHHRAVLSTLRADGRPQLSPVLATVDAQNRVVVSTPGTSVKVRNLRRDPRVALCAITEQFFGSWCQLEGTAEIVSLPEAMEPLIDYYRRTAGEHPDWDDYRTAMKRDQRVLVRFIVERVAPSSSS